MWPQCSWAPNVRSSLARLDHAGVYLLIAGTYTPFGLLVMSRGWAVPVLSVVWSGAAVAILLKLFWGRAPKWLSAAIGLALGWVGVVAFTQLTKVEVAGLALVIAGGLLYSARARSSTPDVVPTPHRLSSATTSSFTCSRSPRRAASSPRSHSSFCLALERERVDGTP
jgi:Haemolysin-III related